MREMGGLRTESRALRAGEVGSRYFNTFLIILVFGFIVLFTSSWFRSSGLVVIVVVVVVVVGIVTVDILIVIITRSRPGQWPSSSSSALPPLPAFPP